LKRLYLLFAVGFAVTIVLRAFLRPPRQERPEKVREREEKASRESTGTVAGAALPRLLVCPNCGYPEATGRTACPHCGVPLVPL